MTKYEYLLDQSFLKQLDYETILTTYCRINILNHDEQPIATIEGKTTGGSININGDSAIRRTGSLSLVADDTMYKITDIRNLISLEKRIELEVGIKNNTRLYQEYPILWFPLGQFVIANASLSHGNQGVSIALSLKDKMALLNGEIGGTINTAVTHSPLYSEDANGNLVSEPARFRNIIYTLLTEFARLPAHRIIIDDIDLMIKNTIRWIGSNTIWLNTNYPVIKIENPNDSENYQAISFNDDIGYTYTDFTYPGELTSNAGESVASVLDKIKNTLGNFEYFFDLDGVFHFQAIKNYLNEGAAADWLTEAINEKYFTNTAQIKSAYQFEGGKINVSYQNSPQYNLVKNDFTVWGELKESKTAIRYHVAIDTPPMIPENGNTWYVKSQEIQLANRKINKITEASRAKKAGYREIKVTDWRTELYLKYISGEDELKYYSKELEEEWPKMYNVIAGEYYTANTDALTYFFDMIDPREIKSFEISQFAIDKIGKRSKVINDKNINCLFKGATYDYCFIEAGQRDTASLRNKCKASGEKYTQISSEQMKNMAIGTAYNPAFDLLRSVLHESIGYNENINLSVAPIYHLEPNTRITIEDKDSNISGDYIIKTMTIPLAVDGSMTIGAKRAVERI